MPVIGVTMGDPSGIGPEIILKSFSDTEISNSRIVVIGDFNIMKSAYDMLMISSFRLSRIKQMQDCTFGNTILNILDLDLMETGQLKTGKMNAVSGAAALDRKSVV